MDVAASSVAATERSPSPSGRRCVPGSATASRWSTTSTPSPRELRGVHPRNPVNQPPGGGVQLELPPRVRRHTGVPTFDPAWEAAIIDALASVAASWTSASSPSRSRARPTTTSSPSPASPNSSGFDAFFRSDHYLKMGDGSGLPGPTDAWIDPRRAGPRHPADPLGTLVTAATFRLPGPLAITVAQVDAMSGGRVELGIGSGWYEEEHRAYGIPFPPLGERFDRLEEQLEIITGLWADTRGRDVLLRRPALPARRQPGAAQARAASTATGHPRRLGAEAHAAAGGSLRRRVQRARSRP